MQKKESAIRYAKAGLRIFPIWWIGDNGKCACGDPTCGGAGSKNNPGKHPIGFFKGKPIVPNGRLDSSANPALVESWWSAIPDANIGLDCSGNGLFVIDIDAHEGFANGFESMEDFETTTGSKVNSNVSAETGGGGLHLIYRAPGDFKSAPAGLGKNYGGVDFKFNGYILLEPSSHKSGKDYSWTDGSLEDLLTKKVPNLPAVIESLIRSGFDDKRSSPERFTAASRPTDSDDIDQIKEALDCLHFTALDDDERLKVGMGLQQLLPGGMGKELYFDWIRAGVPKFDYKLSERRWRSFKYRSGGRTIASFFELAMSFGFENSGKPGEYVDPSEYVIMEPTKISESYDEFFEVMFVDSSVTVPMHVDDDALPSVMFVDLDAQPSFYFEETPNQRTMFKPTRKGDDYINVNEDRNIIRDFIDSGRTESLKLLSSALVSGKENIKGAGMPSPQETKIWTDRLGNRKVLCDLFNWQVENASEYVPEVSIAFTISVLGALLAGRFEHGGLTTNLYFMVIADTSIGKSQTVGLAKRVLETAYDSARIGPKDIVSDKGFYNDLIKDKGRYFLLDEIGELFSNIFGEKSNPSQKLIKRAILDGYTSYKEKTNVTASKADMKNSPIVDLGGICPSIFGLTTPGIIFDALSGKDIVDGLLSRLTILQSESKPADGKIPMDTPLPHSVGEWIHKVRGIYAPGMHVEGSDNVTKLAFSEDAKFLVRKIKEVESTRRNNSKKYSGIWGRLTENTIRTAMIFEIAERPFSSVVQVDSVTLAYELISWCCERSVLLAKSHISDSKEQAMMKEVYLFISKKPKGATLQDITENTKIGGDVRNRRLVTQALKSEQKIVEYEWKSSVTARGRGTMVYFTMETRAEFMETKSGELFFKNAKER